HRPLPGEHQPLGGYVGVFDLDHVDRPVIERTAVPPLRHGPADPSGDQLLTYDDGRWKVKALPRQRLDDPVLQRCRVAQTQRLQRCQEESFENTRSETISFIRSLLTGLNNSIR